MTKLAKLMAVALLVISATACSDPMVPDNAGNSEHPELQNSIASEART